MTVLYFSSTGNCLYAAKKIGGKNYSIPNLIKENKYFFEDDKIGIVFPVYGLCIPPFVKEFLEKLEVKCSYLFCIATYGFFPGAVCGQIKNVSLKNGRCFDYVNKFKMAENCITFADMANQNGDSPEQQKQLNKILGDIQQEKKFIRSDSFLGKITTAHHLKNYEFPTGIGITEKLSINDGCSGCGTCTKVCPMNNIRLENGKPVFDRNCISCGACIQNCSMNAIHHSEEKSSARYRNPHIQLQELMYR